MLSDERKVNGDERLHNINVEVCTFLLLGQNGGGIYQTQIGSLVFNGMATFSENGAFEVSLPTFTLPRADRQEFARLSPLILIDIGSPFDRLHRLRYKHGPKLAVLDGHTRFTARFDRCVAG